jgi:hypothetical protein
MVLHYRETDPVSGRWTGSTSGAPLSSFQGDENIFTLNTAIAAVAATVTPSRSISSITTSGNDITFHMSDSTLEGPFTIIPATFNGRGAWAPSTAYSVNDTFYINGTVYLVIFAHISASTFSAGANDGLGHNYYAVMVPNPGNALPTGGAPRTNLKKSTSADYAVTFGFDLASDTIFLPSTASGLTSTNVSDALEELETLTSNKALSTLSDVSFNTAGPVSGEFLRFNGTKWANVTLSVAFSDISGVILTSAAVGDLFSFDGTDWVNVPQSTLSVGFSQITGSASASQLRDATVTVLGFGTSSLDPSLGNIFTITPGGPVTINAASAPAGAEITVIVTTTGTSSFNVTPNTNFKSQGALATGTVSGKTFAIKFVGDGTDLVEVSRTTAM